MARVAGDKNLSLREQRKDAENKALKAENTAMKLKLKAEQLRVKELAKRLESK